MLMSAFGMYEQPPPNPGVVESEEGSKWVLVTSGTFRVWYVHQSVICKARYEYTTGYKYYLRMTI
jgi:hypothetical protein